MMKKILVFVCMLLSIYRTSAQSQNTTYSGTIKGYSASIGFKNAQLLVDNVVTGLHDMYLIDIKPDGTFYANFPLVHKQGCWITFPFFNSVVYFEPGKKLVQDFDVTDVRKVSSVFKGDAKMALINNDINKVRPILMDYNWNAIYSDIYQLTPEQFKAYFLKIRNHKLALIDSVAKASNINIHTYELARRSVQYNIAAVLIQYNSLRENAYRIRNKLPFDSKKPVLSPVKLNTAYYYFLKEIKYNDVAAMEVYDYYQFMNWLMFIEPIYDKAGRIDYTNEINLLKTKDTSNKDVKATIAYYENMAWRNPTAPGALEKARPAVLKSLLNTNISLEFELMDLQVVSQRMDDEKDTLSDAEFARVKARIKNKFLLADVAALNNKIKQNIRDSKTSKGYTYNQIQANAPADSFFVKMMDKYKGKAVFIDFWATWCAPCMISLKEIAPLKEDLAQNKDIVFLYITNTSSPEKSYKTVMPGIKGEHYRVTQDQYNLLAKQFQVTGIPHYALVNKRGNIVDRDFKWNQTDQIKKQLLALANE
ncbi:TlpA family protein disulfide reductase [Mucilaginibacter corticis]|uniref:TlpA family protein disulfide reductase n=1 Tax=Mucilaginibacter corticis TaxID=2597670 RepID=A0A556MUX8_9SPHI|nr:TlpA disulfide reductase family protein [Mucilaginibacter corticis]TSJ43665.1 TlpA family protein disulfide reductase [Mucilaginibacter corticis]